MDKALRNSMKILVIEDNQSILGNIIDYLDGLGYITDSAQDGVTGLHFAVTRQYALIILDLMLPGIDGISLCKRLREEADIQTPIIMLTARDTVNDKITGLEAGADDYVVKPFSLEELEARIKAVLKRSRNPSGSTVLQVGDLMYNTMTFEVARAGQPIKLNPIALQLLECLMRASPNVVKRQQLEEAIWGNDPCDSDALRTHIHMLRQSIDKPFGRPLLHTVHKIGYRLVGQD